MIITNELNERYVYVCEFGEVTETEDGAYHVDHAALIEDRYIRTTFSKLLDILKSLDDAYKRTAVYSGLC